MVVGGRTVAKTVTESTLETPALYEKLLELTKLIQTFSRDDEVKPKHDPGGKVRIKLALDVKSNIVFGGPDDCYRYRLSRTWDKIQPHVLWVMMNPSVADHDGDDPTVAKCGRLARAWGYGDIYVGNTFQCWDC